MRDTAPALVRANLEQVRERIDHAAAGRVIRLVCVTKYANPAWIEHLLAAGATELGENLLPRAVDRFTWFTSFGYSFTRHLLGTQQSRKVKHVADACDLFQALDGERTAGLLQAWLGPRKRRLDVLLEVNIDGEPQKAGWLAGEIEAAASHLSTRYPSLSLRGLMCVPRGRQPGEGSDAYEARSRKSFAAMRYLFDRIGAALPERWDTLSMGMSQDYAWAIAEGATMVRIGSALFAGLEG